MEDQLKALLRRLEAAPGIPVPNPTPSYWQEPPHPLHNIQSPELASSADIVIIGSGITACSIVKTLLEGCRDSALDEGKYPRIVVLEARTLCSGGTGRNGGHIKETPHEHWNYLRETFGIDAARDITRFRLKHLDDLLKITKAEGLEEVTEARKVKTVDLHYDKHFYQESVDNLKQFRVEMAGFLDPETDADWKALSEDEVVKVRLNLAKREPSLTVWPGIRNSRLLRRHLLPRRRPLSLRLHSSPLCLLPPHLPQP
jgi:hypothetical protein